MKRWNIEAISRQIIKAEIESVINSLPRKKNSRLPDFTAKFYQTYRTNWKELFLTYVKQLERRSQLQTHSTKSALYSKTSTYNKKLAVDQYPLKSNANIFSKIVNPTTCQKSTVPKVTLMPEIQGYLKICKPIFTTLTWTKWRIKAVYIVK